MPQTVSDDRARQGPSGRPVLGVLLGGLTLLGIALAGLMIWIGSTTPDSPSQDAARQTTTGDPKGRTANPTNQISPANPAYPTPSEPTATGTTRQ